MNQGEALAAIPQGTTALTAFEAPEQVLAQAQRAAKALMNVINAKPKEEKVIMNGKLYLEFEDWSTLGRFFNTTTRIKRTEFINYGNVTGFEAVAEAVQTSFNGEQVIIGVADAMCLDDEENWGDRPKYEWQDVIKDGQKVWEPNPNKPGQNRAKRERVQVGSEPTPLFQLRSMAQTRACAKVLRQCFSWVVVLANNEGVRIATTPAEEMQGSTIEGGDAGEGHAPIQAAKTVKREGTKISEGQRKRMYAMAREAGFDPDTRVKEVITAYGYEHDADVVRGTDEGFYDYICKALVDKTWKAPAPKEAAAAAPAPAGASNLRAATLEGNCTHVVGPKRDGKGDYMAVALEGGMEVYCRKPDAFALLKDVKGQPCRFKVLVDPNSPTKALLTSILRVGDKEWLEDGTPVTQLDRGQDDGPGDAPNTEEPGVALPGFDK